MDRKLAGASFNEPHTIGILRHSQLISLLRPHKP